MNSRLGLTITSKNLKKNSFYKELRYIFRAFFHYGRPFSYLSGRFLIRPKIRQAGPIGQIGQIDDRYSVHILCSHQDLDMLFWSLASWYKIVENSGQVFIHEDGSFSEEDRNLIAKLLPNARLVDKKWAASLAEQVWLKDLPNALKYRLDKRYVFAVKLMDARFVSDAPARLLLDTDILWFREPTELLQKLKSGKNPFFMLGKTNLSFQFADGGYLDEKLSAFNAGIIGYNAAHYPASDLEEFCKKMGPQSNPYFIEQSGHAWILSRHARILPLDPARYIIKGPVNSETVVRHYTGPRRELYWIEGVKILKDKILT